MEKSYCVKFIVVVSIAVFIFAYSRYPPENLGCFVSTPSWPNSSHYFTDTPLHPLDPLTVPEINRVRSILSAHETFSSSFPPINTLSLDEPEKIQVLGWKRGDPFPPRKASVVAFLNGQTHLMTVDLGQGLVTSDVVNTGSGYPMLTINDLETALQVTYSSLEFNKSILARGVDFDYLTCTPLSSCWFGPDEEGKRIIKVQCYSNQDTPNFYMRPKEGLTVVVYIDKKEAMIWAEDGDYRSVMYKDFASELFVPYMDPDQAWYFKSYMDVGEFGLWENAMALLELNDCSRYAYYMDVVFANNDGRPFIQPNIICIFERYAGDIGWRHSEIPIMGFDVGKNYPFLVLP
ncbi:hypothetical protein L1887_27146 [Cichorium endivia]|nr:hypothetical protein L1887_27146 [Cichorium endivia]